jgi:hypothetical protein
VGSGVRPGPSDHDPTAWIARERSQAAAGDDALRRAAAMLTGLSWGARPRAQAVLG